MDIEVGMEGAKVTNTVFRFLLLFFFLTELCFKVHRALNRNPWILSFKDGTFRSLVDTRVSDQCQFWVTLRVPSKTVITDCTGLPASLSAWWGAGSMECLLVESYSFWRLPVKYETEVPGPPGTWAWAVALRCIQLGVFRWLCLSLFPVVICRLQF